MLKALDYLQALVVQSDDVRIARKEYDDDDLLEEGTSFLSKVVIYIGSNRNRTGDLMLAKHSLYQLSYTPLIQRFRLTYLTFKKKVKLVKAGGGIEPPYLDLQSSALTIMLSSQPSSFLGV
jgi:hypothetical protein